MKCRKLVSANGTAVCHSPENPKKGGKGKHMTYKKKQYHSDRAKAVADITAKLEKGVVDVFNSDNYKQYLSTMSRFHSYSFKNSLLIYMQKPDATLVAGYQSWIKDHKRHIKPGEKGIRILAPCPYKSKMVKEEHPDVEDDKGKGRTVEITQMYFKPVAVFDISQTEGEDLPEICHNLTGGTDNYDQFLDILCRTAPVPVVFDNLPGGASGCYSDTNRQITIQKDMPQAQTLKTLVHEITHSVLHAGEAFDETDRRTKEVQAESTAYVVCCYYGLDTSDYSFGYIAGWSSDKDIKELKASLEVIRDTADKLITEIDRQLR